MDKNSIINIVNRFTQLLQAQNIRPQKIILYGSCASGTNKEGSDIDLIVISDDFFKKDYWERIEILTEAIYQIFEPIEAVAMTPEEWERGDSFIVDYAKNGEILYAA